MGTNGFPSLMFQREDLLKEFNIPNSKPADKIPAKPMERGIIRRSPSWGSPSCLSIRLSVNMSAGMGHISSCSISSQPPQGPRQSRRGSDCQTQSLAWRASCQPDNVLRQLRETQSLSFGGIGQREKDSLSWVCGAAEGGGQEKGCDSWCHKVCSQNRSGDIMSGMGPRAP